MSLILSLDSAGNPHKWIDWETAIVYHAKGLVAWSYGENQVTYNGGVQRISGERSSITTSSIIAVKGETSKRFKPPALSNRALFRRDLNLCGFCGNQFSHDKLTRDHIMPKSRGGADSWMNTVTACTKCNHKKGARTPEEAGMKLLFVPYTPSRNEHLLLMNRRILYEQMAFLLSMIPEKSRAHEYAKVHMSIQ